VGDGRRQHADCGHSVHPRQRRLRLAQRFGGEHVFGEIARDHEHCLQALRVEPQRRIGHRQVEAAQFGCEPFRESDVLAGEAAVEMRLQGALEDVGPRKVSDMHADDSLGRHPPIALIDRVDSLITVVPADHGHAIGGTLEHLARQILGPLSRGEIRHGHRLEQLAAGERLGQCACGPKRDRAVCVQAASQLEEARDRDHRDVRVMPLQLGDDDRATRSRHVDVGDHQRRRRRSHGRKPGASIRGLAHHVASRLQPLRQGFAHDLVVFDDEDVIGRSHDLRRGDRSLQGILRSSCRCLSRPS
jgi:hypothetical protein